MLPAIDVLVTADRIHTLGAEGTVEAVAVRDGRVFAAGRTDDLMALAGPNTRHVDLSGLDVVPGFVETHMHPIYAGLGSDAVTITTPPHQTIGDVLGEIRAHASAVDADTPIRSWGFDDTGVRENRHLVAADLDQVAPDHLIMIQHISGHFATVNSRVLREAGIDATTPDPPGGRIDRTADGEPTGLLEEPAAIDLARSAVPDYGYRDFRRGAAIASHMAARTGTTTITDMAVWEWEMFRAYQDAVSAREVGVRVRLAPFASYLDDMPFHSGFGDDRLRIGPVKFMADGSIQGYTACLSHPYHDRPDAEGVAPMPHDELTQRVREAHRRGFQVAIHANGDQAIDWALDAIAAAGSPKEVADRRHRIEHFQTARPDQIVRAAEMGIGVSMFVNHVWFWGDRHHGRFLGPERANRLDPVREVAEAGVPFGLHCDAPVTPLNPLFTMWCAVNRVTSGGRPLGVDQAVDVATALRGYTTDAAWISREEHAIGQLVPGHLADMAVLDGNPFTVDPSRLSDLNVIRTVVGGETVFEA